MGVPNHLLTGMILQATIFFPQLFHLLCAWRPAHAHQHLALKGGEHTTVDVGKHEMMNQWLFLVPVKGGRWHSPSPNWQYIPLIVHLLWEPETTIEWRWPTLWMSWFFSAKLRPDPVSGSEFSDRKTYVGLWLTHLFRELRTYTYMGFIMVYNPFTKYQQDIPV